MLSVLIPETACTVVGPSSCSLLQLRQSTAQLAVSYWTSFHAGPFAVVDTRTKYIQVQPKPIKEVAVNRFKTSSVKLSFTS